MKNVKYMRKITYIALTLVVLCTAIPVKVDAASKLKIKSFVESTYTTDQVVKINLKASGTKSYKVYISTKKNKSLQKVKFKKNDNGKNETFTIKKCGSKKIKANKTYYVKVELYSKKNFEGKKVSKNYKVHSQSMPIYSSAISSSSQVASSVTSTITPTLISSVTSYGQWENVGTPISTQEYGSAVTETENLYNGVAMTLYYDFDENGNKGEVGAFGYNTTYVPFAGYENVSLWYLGSNILPCGYQIGLLETETTPVYNVTTQDMSTAYRTVTEYRRYSDGSSEQVSHTETYADVYNTTSIVSRELADESEFLVSYTYHIDQYYAQLFDYANGEEIALYGYSSGHGLYFSNNTWYEWALDKESTVIFDYSR
ncbi:MAG: hypothetical protein K6B41_09470 [Butyrivibrio sp.]|nr:hypothetical protein [Butyrivibrio sp.]